MSTAPVSTKPVIHAAKDFVEFGQGVSKNFGFVRHVAICITAGIGLGLVWKTWHWNEKRFIAQYYADLAKKEAKEEAERQTVIKAKFAELERELSS
ncbi:cytochrome c oxidase 11 kd subunit [Haematococcus lacustris]|uniref:Uncharacterized protein n=1 Tax=Haematococcus lacustris TaxID=44745 RepID=A0A699YFZ2_HAELA|nr:uncharacterized protein HaLaN_00495 [Haematococcus lacustris]GFH32476.1 uncharacterized protein HaLaN_31704 [Haematococcus lacustris]